MAADMGFGYEELRDMPLPELSVVEEEVKRILERRKAHHQREMQAARRRGRR